MELYSFIEWMKGATFMIPTQRLLDQVVQMIAIIKMDDRDTKGDLYEYLLSKIAVHVRVLENRNIFHHLY